MCIYYLTFLIVLSSVHPTIYVLLQLVRKHYDPSARCQSTLVKFEEDQITLNIPDDGTVTKEGWRITPFTTPTVSGTETSLYSTNSHSDLNNTANSLGIQAH